MRMSAAHRWALLVPMVVLPVLPATEAAAQGKGTAVLGRELDAYIGQGLRDWSIPGLSVAVVQADSIVFLRGYGVRELGEPGLVDPNTLFGIMSTTKAMTTMAIAMLVDDGKLQWDDPVSRWVPEFQMPDAWVGRAITVEDLLTHNTGLGEADLLWYRGDMSAAEIIRRVQYQTPAYSLRAGFVYQNIMYGLAGEVVARVSGVSYPEFLRRRIFGPLGMSRTYPTITAALASGDSNISRAHFRIRDTIRVIADDSIDVLPAAGSVWSTAGDMALWLQFLLDSGRVGNRRLASVESFRRLFAPHTVVSFEQFYPTALRTNPHWMTYGLGWFQQDYAGQFIAFHTGSLDGRTAIVGLMPGKRLGVVVLGNLDHAEFRHALMLKVLDLYGGLPSRDWSTELRALYDSLRVSAESVRATAQRRRIPDTKPTHPLPQYAGRYDSDAWGTVIVSESSGVLTMAIGTNPQLRGRLEHWNYDTFMARLGDGRSPGELVQFLMNPAGDVTALRLTGAEFKR